MSGTQLARGGGFSGVSLFRCVCMPTLQIKKKMKADFSQRRCEKKGGKSSDWLSHDHVILQTLFTN